MPAILLDGDHYVALLKVEEDHARVYDPRLKSQTHHPLPPRDDPDYTATVLLFSDPETKP
jgi:ABC-type bacteriocin/lantibiotic exporter with double-glycine peptidase domain